MEVMKRSATCGALNSSHVGQKVILNGWVHRKREHGEISFFNLRDRYGITQVMIDSDSSEELKKISQSIKMEYCVAVEFFQPARFSLFKLTKKQMQMKIYA